jgi:hypothetical protein
MRGIEIREAVPSGGTSKALRCLEELDESEGGGGRKGRAVAKSERATLFLSEGPGGLVAS